MYQTSLIFLLFVVFRSLIRLSSTFIRKKKGLDGTLNSKRFNRTGPPWTPIRQRPKGRERVVRTDFQVSNTVTSRPRV